MVVKFDFSATLKIVNVTYERATKAKLLPTYLRSLYTL